MDVISTGAVTRAKTNKRQKGNTYSSCGLDTGRYFKWCPKQDKDKTHASGSPFQKYHMNSPGARNMFITTIESTMTMLYMYRKLHNGLCGLLEVGWCKRSFIVKEAHAPMRRGLSVTQLVSRLNLIGSGGNKDTQRQNTWMTGAVTKDMITPRGCGQNQNQHLFITTLF
jgi:hypothetical protein